MAMPVVGERAERLAAEKAERAERLSLEEKRVAFEKEEKRLAAEKAERQAVVESEEKRLADRARREFRHASGGEGSARGSGEEEAGRIGRT